jgi:hypothetical protein
MESLYVCLFSNGHIKVGRSVSPVSRIAAHADRVSCMGVELADSQHWPCQRNAMSAEFDLIKRCTNEASARYQNEWFAGLAYADVCAWAEQEATRTEHTKPETDTRWMRVLDDLRRAGVTYTSIAAQCKCGATTISRLALGQQAEPMHSMGETLLLLHRQSIPS